MRIHISLLILLIILSGTFFCSNSPFDSDTSLGTDILNDKDPLLTIFDAKFCEDTLDSTTGSSFIDEADSLISGLHKRDNLKYLYDVDKKTYYYMYFGSWQNEHAYSYLQFDGSKIEEWLETIKSDTNYLLLSFSFNFTNLSFMSDPTENAIIELGYYDTAKKSETEKMDITKLKEIAHYSYTASIKTGHEISLNTEYIDTTLPVLNITSQRNTQGYVHTVEVGYDTLNIFDTLQDTISYIKDMIVYDSITPVSQLVKDGQLISQSSSDSISIGDTTVYWDTVITIPETTVTYAINTILVHIIEGLDTTDVIQYDTVNILTAISQDTIIQRSTKSPKESLILKASNPEWWDITEKDTVKNICMYVRLDSVQSNSMQFIDNVHLSLKYLKVNKNDTITKTLRPSYYDVSVFESDPLSLDTIIHSSSASGRFALLELDLKPIWDSMRDSTGQIRYRNFPRANLTLKTDTVILHKSAMASTSIRYALIDKKVNSIEEIDDYNLLTSISTTTENPGITINNFLIDMLYTSTPLPDKGYLYIGMYPFHCAQIRWKIPDEGFPISYIILR